VHSTCNREIGVVPTGSLAQCGPHLYPLLLAVLGPMSVRAAVVRADRLALASLCRRWPGDACGGPPHCQQSSSWSHG
jgi:hypothetical protein